MFAHIGPDAPRIDDFVRAAGISRGTVYNHVENVDELPAATSVWTTRELIETIETALAGIERPLSGWRSGSGSSSPWRKPTRSGASSWRGL